MPSDRTTREVYDSLSALLSPPTTFPAGRYRSTSEVADGLKRIRRIILTEGIPEIVSAHSPPQHPIRTMPWTSETIIPAQ